MFSFWALILCSAYFVEPDYYFLVSDISPILILTKVPKKFWIEINCILFFEKYSAYSIDQKEKTKSNRRR